MLDPDVEPDPASTELQVLINERDCASGQPPIGRGVLPVVVSDENRIVITVLVAPVAGSATCPSNPWHPVTIDLDEALGDRQILDGSTLPPVALPWPPTQPSLDN